MRVTRIVFSSTVADPAQFYDSRSMTNQQPAHGHAHPAADWVTKDEKRWIRELLQPADSRQNPQVTE